MAAVSATCYMEGAGEVTPPFAALPEPLWETYEDFADVSGFAVVLSAAKSALKLRVTDPTQAAFKFEGVFRMENLVYVGFHARLEFEFVLNLIRGALGDDELLSAEIGRVDDGLSLKIVDYYKLDYNLPLGCFPLDQTDILKSQLAEVQKGSEEKDHVIEDLLKRVEKSTGIALKLDELTVENVKLMTERRSLTEEMKAMKLRIDELLAETKKMQREKVELMEAMKMMEPRKASVRRAAGKKRMRRGSRKRQAYLMGKLVDKLVGDGVIKSQTVADAMYATDRGDYCVTDAYKDKSQRIGYNTTISGPHMHAHALELLSAKLMLGSNALDVGSGSGYMCAVMAKMMGSKGKVVGIEHIQELVELSIENISKSDELLLESGRVTIVCGDGRNGYAPKSPYDCIHVGAAASTDVPPVLCRQLKAGGILVIPVDTSRSSARSSHVCGTQVYRLYTKNARGEVSCKDLFGVLFSPLTDERTQRRRIRACVCSTS